MCERASIHPATQPGHWSQWVAQRLSMLPIARIAMIWRCWYVGAAGAQLNCLRGSSLSLVMLQQNWLKCVPTWVCWGSGAGRLGFAEEHERRWMQLQSPSHSPSSGMTPSSSDPLTALRFFFLTPASLATALTWAKWGSRRASKPHTTKQQPVATKIHLSEMRKIGAQGAAGGLGGGGLTTL